MARDGYIMKIINSADIVTSAGYQRPVDAREVRKIVAHWDENQVNPPKVSYRNGKFYVFDGQHTINALKLRNDGKDVDVLCRVYTGLTYEDEARLFAAQNGISKSVTTAQKIKALYEANDPDIMAVRELVLSHGYPEPIAVSGSHTNGFRVMPTALRVYKKHGINRVNTILDIVTTAWGNDRDGCKAGIIDGLDVLLTIYGNDINPKELSKSLSRVSPVRLEADSKADTLHRGANRYAYQMVRVYNKRKQYRLDEREIR